MGVKFFHTWTELEALAEVYTMGIFLVGRVLSLLLFGYNNQ